MKPYGSRSLEAAHTALAYCKMGAVAAFQVTDWLTRRVVDNDRHPRVGASLLVDLFHLLRASGGELLRLCRLRGEGESENEGNKTNFFQQLVHRFYLS